MKRLLPFLLVLAACGDCATSRAFIPRHVIAEATHRNVIVEYTAPIGREYCSGVVLSTGRVLTAGHCFGTDITVNRVPAKVAKRRDNPDLELLIVQSPEYAPVVIGDVAQADDVFSIANHAPWTDIFNRGYVALLEKGWVCTHFLAVPGFSGSGLYTPDGRLVGINVQLNVAAIDTGVVPMWAWAVDGATIREFLVNT